MLTLWLLAYDARLRVAISMLKTLKPEKVFRTCIKADGYSPGMIRCANLTIADGGPPVVGAAACLLLQTGLIATDLLEKFIS
jgi:hypothetical protein